MMTTEFLQSLQPIVTLVIFALFVITLIRTAIAFREKTFREVFTACVFFAVVLTLLSTRSFLSPVPSKIDLSPPSEWSEPKGLVPPTVDEQMRGVRGERSDLPPLPIQVWKSVKPDAPSTPNRSAR